MAKKNIKKKSKKATKAIDSEVKESLHDKSEDDTFILDSLQELKELGVEEGDVDKEEEAKLPEKIMKKIVKTKDKAKFKKINQGKPRKGLGEELIEVYETAGDELTSVTTLEHRRRTWQRMLVWILFFLIAVFIGVAAISWYIWGGVDQFTGENVEFSIEAPEEASSGQLVSFSIQYVNNEQASFRKSEIELRYPPGFIYESSEPEPATGNNIWDLGSLSAAEQGVITLDGYLVGHPDIDTTISGVFRYWPANFSSEFREVASAQTKMIALDVELRLDGPEQVLVGQTTNYNIVVNNVSDNDVKDIMIEIIFPAEFVVDESNPEPDELNNIWKIDQLASEEEKEIQLDGYFSAAPEDEIELIVNLSQKGSEDDYFQQKEERLPTKVIDGDLVVNLIANGSTKSSTLQWGDIVNASINFQNNSEAELSDLKAVVKLETRYRTQGAEKGADGALDWAGLVDAGNGSQKILDSLDDNTLEHRSITWIADDIVELEKLEAEEEGAINFQIPLLRLADAIDQIGHPEDVDVVLTVEMVIGQTGDVEDEVVVSSNVITFSVDTDLLLDAHARYFDDDGNELGGGPLPPEVGEKTTYRIIWDLSNTLHEVQDLIVSAEFPSNVSWANAFDVSAGEVDFRAADNTLTWRLNKLPLDVENATLGFDIELNPADRQIDEVANLTKKITMTATDSATGGKIIQTISSLNTGVERDENAADKGLVVE